MIASLLPCDVADPTLPIAGLVLVWSAAALWHRRARWRAAPLVVAGLATGVLLALAWIVLQAPDGCPPS